MFTDKGMRGRGWEIPAGASWLCPPSLNPTGGCCEVNPAAPRDGKLEVEAAAEGIRATG